MKYKAALFDMDGVILDSEPLHLAAFQLTLKNHDKNLSDDQYKQFFAGRTDEAGFQLYFDFIGESVNLPLIMDQKAKNYLKLAADQLVAYPGVVELVKKLSDVMPLALVTGSLRVEAETALNTLGIAEQFQVMVCAEDISEGKPNPEGYLKARDILGISHNDCVIVEDAPSGVLAAKNAGIDCIAVAHTHSNDELGEATVVVDKLTLNLF